MPYVPDWQPLAAALERVMATGATEDNAKLDICRAVADQKIDVRVRIAASEYDWGAGLSPTATSAYRCVSTPGISIGFVHAH